MDRQRVNDQRSLSLMPEATTLWSSNYGYVVITQGHENFLFHMARDQFIEDITRLWLKERVNITDITRWLKRNKLPFGKLRNKDITK